MENMDNRMRTDTFAADEVRSLDLRIAAANVRTREAAGREIRVEAENLQEDRYTCELRSGKLVIAYRVNGIVNLPRSGGEKEEITVYLPAGLSLEYAVLEIGAGTIDLDAAPISCGTMDVEIGAGKWNAAQLSVSGRLDVQIGAGKARMKAVTAGSLSIDCGVGSGVYKGRVNGDIRVACGVGSCSLELDNKESDFNYDISCAVGSVRINGSRSKSFGARKSYKNDSALGTAVLDCSVGSIELRTRDKDPGAKDSI